MDVWWFPTISQVKIWNHPVETTTKTWWFKVPGMDQVNTQTPHWVSGLLIPGLGNAWYPFPFRISPFMTQNQLGSFSKMDLWKKTNTVRQFCEFVTCLGWWVKNSENVDPFKRLSLVTFNYRGYILLGHGKKNHLVGSILVIPYMAFHSR